MMKEKTTYDLNMRWYWYLLGPGVPVRQHGNKSSSRASPFGDSFIPLDPAIILIF